MYGVFPVSLRGAEASNPPLTTQALQERKVESDHYAPKTQAPPTSASKGISERKQSMQGRTERSTSASAVVTSNEETAHSPTSRSQVRTPNWPAQSIRFPSPPVTAMSFSVKNYSHDSSRRRCDSTGSILSSSPVLRSTSATSPTIPELQAEPQSNDTTRVKAASSAAASEAVRIKKPHCIRKKAPIRKKDNSAQRMSATANALPEKIPSRIVCPVPPSLGTNSGVSSPLQTALASASPTGSAPIEPLTSVSGDVVSMPSAVEGSTASNLVVVPQPSGVSPPEASSRGWSAPMHTHEVPEHLPTDEPDVLIPADKYTYDLKTCAWKGVSTMIRVLHPNRGLSQGSMRVCFALEEVDETGFSSQMVAKLFRHTISKVIEGDYFNEGEAQCICGIFAEKFNRIEVPRSFQRHVISFLQCETVRIRRSDIPEGYQRKRRGFFSYHPTDSGDILFTMEPRLHGNFTKYTGNFGGVYEGFERRLSSEEERRRHRILLAVEAFSHFTFLETGGSMLVCDLQGVHDFLTDPQIHTEDGKGFGMGNMGQKGIEKWREAHVCNEVCKAMKLAPLSKDWGGFTTAAERENRMSYYKVLRAKLSSSVPGGAEDILPLPKPLSQMSDDERLDYAMQLSLM